MADPGAPLRGRTVVITRAAQRAGVFGDLLRAQGATVLEVPLVEIVDVASNDELSAAIGALTAADWLVITSPEGAMRARRAIGDPQHLAAQVATIGASTAERFGRADLVPADQRAAGLVAVFPEPSASDGQVLVVQAAGGTDELVAGLTRRGWRVRRIDSHLSVPVTPDDDARRAVARADAVAFTSGSQARAWVLAFGTSAPGVVVAIGPQTAADARAAGLAVNAVATDHSLPGVIDALVAACATT